jgi:hypothetical protein
VQDRSPATTSVKVMEQAKDQEQGDSEIFYTSQSLFKESPLQTVIRLEGDGSTIQNNSGIEESNSPTQPQATNTKSEPFAESSDPTKEVAVPNSMRECISAADTHHTSRPDHRLQTPAAFEDLIPSLIDFIPPPMTNTTLPTRTHQLTQIPKPLSSDCRRRLLNAVLETPLEPHTSQQIHAYSSQPALENGVLRREESRLCCFQTNISSSTACL